MLNSNDAALTSACDSVRELRLVRAGEAKADRMKTAEESERKRKNAMDKNVKVVVERGIQHFDLLLIWGEKKNIEKPKDETTRRYCGNVMNLCFGE